MRQTEGKVASNEQDHELNTNLRTLKMYKKDKYFPESPQYRKGHLILKLGSDRFRPLENKEIHK
jgi:hypothetical protein